ncbi:MAG: indole-3-glycerol phosphate synthase TrpC [Candidatus Zixiibacteriota bacterium]
MDILQEIAAAKRLEVAAMKSATSIADLERTVIPAPRFSFQRALSRPGNQIIAEIKQKSPSKGVLSQDFDLTKLASAYFEGGAAALSILTDRKYFGGDPAYIALAKTVAKLPVLYKDFVVDEYQLYHARSVGADAVLLIVRMMTRKSLSDFLARAAKLELDCLVETHSEPEIEIALDSGAQIIGVNCRDLSNFSVSLEVAKKLGSQIPTGITKVAESGISTPEDIRALHQSGFNCFLIGESLMKSSDPVQFLRSLVAA